MSEQSSFQKVGECLYRNTSSGSYYALVKVRGKQIKESLQTKDLAEARRKLKDFRKDADKRDPSAGRLTLAQLADKFEKTIQHQAEGTIANKVRILDRVRKEWPGGAERKVGKIKASEGAEFLSAYKGAPGFNQALEVLRAMFDLAEEDGMIARSPAAKIKWRKREAPIRLAPSPAEFGAIVTSIRTQPFSDTAKESADFVEFLGLAGMGNAEAVGLAWSHVDFERGQFIAFREKTRAGFAVPIFPQLRPLLERRWAEAVESNGGKPPRPETRVFSIADPKKALAAACVRLNLPAYSSRAFRRMFITDAIERGVDVKVIAQWQGHKDGGKLILGTYSHVRPVHSQRMAALMVGESPANVFPIKAEVAA